MEKSYTGQNQVLNSRNHAVIQIMN